ANLFAHSIGSQDSVDRFKPRSFFRCHSANIHHQLRFPILKLKLGRVPASSPLPSRLCLLCRFSQKLHSTSRFAHLRRTPPRGSIRSWLPSQLYLDHSHCPVLAPATLTALPSTRAIETRLLPSFDSCAPAHFDLSVLPIYVARAPAAPFSPLPTAALPSMSVSPN